MLAFKSTASRTLLALAICGAAQAANIPLTYPYPGYPTLLAVSCGGVQVSTYTSGFDAQGNVSGEIQATTGCGVSGRGGGYKSRTYTSWHSGVWGIDGTYYALLTWDNLLPDPSWVETDGLGNTISTVHIGALYQRLLVTP